MCEGLKYLFVCSLSCTQVMASLTNAQDYHTHVKGAAFVICLVYRFLLAAQSKDLITPKQLDEAEYREDLSKPQARALVNSTLPQCLLAVWTNHCKILQQWRHSMQCLMITKLGTKLCRTEPVHDKKIALQLTSIHVLRNQEVSVRVAHTSSTCLTVRSR